MGKLNNTYFKGVEFDYFRNEAGSNYFTMSPTKWIEGANAIGIISKSGRYGETYAHKDIVLQFVSWISPELHLYIIKEFKSLKESEHLSLKWITIKQMEILQEKFLK